MTNLFKLLFPKAIWNSKIDKVLLTIDDSPTKNGTEQILKLLQENRIKALFFVCGKEIEKNINLIKEINSEGHTIGNHSFSHQSLLFKSTNFIYDEIKKTDELLKNNIKIDTLYFRPPYGRINFYTNVVDNLGKKIVMWDILTYDYKNNIKIIKFAVQKCKNNSIITMHDNIKTEKQVKENFKCVIDSVLSKGFNFGEPIECLK
jgi:peptidoglycan/xylan/chitin deacetylase (PgdA/CDA1 family)